MYDYYKIIIAVQVLKQIINFYLSIQLIEVNIQITNIIHHKSEANFQ